MRATVAAVGLLLTLLLGPPGLTQPASGDEPKIGQESKDSVWVPTPERLIRRISGERMGKPLAVIGAGLRGTEIRFTAFDRDGSSRQFSGSVDGARMSGDSQGEGIAALRWSAVLR